jgi:hypothetical protein
MNGNRLFGMGIIAGSLAFAGIPAAEASYTVNGLGFGTATASVWCAPNAPPAAPNYSATSTGFVPTASFGPGLAGCNPNTSVFVSAGSFWRANTQAVALGGDTVAWDHSLSLATPTSPMATTFLDVTATLIDSFTVEFSIDWAGSDAGTAQHLQWFDMSGPTAVLLGEEVRVGPWSETDFIKTILFPGGGLDTGGEEFLVMVSDGVAMSTIPEPSTFALAALGLAGMSLKSRRKPA